MVPDEPLDEIAARRLIRNIIERGTVRWTAHALQRLPARDLTTVDCVNVLRAGVVHPPELENGTWRYRVRGGRINVIVALRSEDTLVVITAWRTG